MLAIAQHGQAIWHYAGQYLYKPYLLFIKITLSAKNCASMTVLPRANLAVLAASAILNRS